MKRVVVIVFLIIAFEAVYSLLTPLSSGATPANAMFRANLERTGIYKTQGLQRLHGVKWKFKTERVIEAWFSSPTVSGEIVYVGSDDSYLYALNALNGELKWRQRFISAAGMLICTPWIRRPDGRNGDLRQGRGFSDHLRSLRTRFMLVARMASSMRSIRNRDMSDGGQDEREN